MKRFARVLRRTFPVAALAIVVSACGVSSSSGAGPSTKPTSSMGGMKGGMEPGGKSSKLNMNRPTTQVAPAQTAMLMPMGQACGKKVTGSGMVEMVPVHVGKMTGPHMNLVISLHGATPGEKLGISGVLAGAHSWSGMAESDKVDMMGSLNVKTRLMPMLRAGHYTAQIMLHDESCLGGMSLAYETPRTTITLR